jgi:hypothetical protein
LRFTLLELTQAGFCYHLLYCLLKRAVFFELNSAVHILASANMSRFFFPVTVLLLFIENFSPFRVLLISKSQHEKFPAANFSLKYFEDYPCQAGTPPAINRGGTTRVRRVLPRHRLGVGVLPVSSGYSPAFLKGGLGALPVSGG